MKNIGLVSDLHLEGSNLDALDNPLWDYLVIAGDLSTDLDTIDLFFEYKCPKNIPVIYVLGNHEFDYKNFFETKIKIKKLLENYPNVYLLDNQTIILDDIKFIGTTLWTDLNLNNELSKNKEYVNKFISHLNSIYYKSNNKAYPIDADFIIEQHQIALNFLKNELINDLFDGSKVVISHFSPHGKSIKKSFEYNNNSYWASDLSNLLGYSDLWLHGHVHHSLNYQVKSTRIITNPRGYSKLFNIHQNENFDPNFNIELKNKLIKKNKFRI